MSLSKQIVVQALQNNIPYTGHIQLFGADFTVEQLLRLVEFAKPKYDLASILENGGTSSLTSLCKTNELDESDLCKLSMLFCQRYMVAHLQILVKYDPNIFTRKVRDELSLEQFALQQWMSGNGFIACRTCLKCMGTTTDKVILNIMKVDEISPVELAREFLRCAHDTMRELHFRFFDILGLPFNSTMDAASIVEREEELYAIYYFARAGNLDGVKYCIDRGFRFWSINIKQKIVPHVTFEAILAELDKPHLLRL